MTRLDLLQQRESKSLNQIFYFSIAETDKNRPVKTNIVNGKCSIIEHHFMSRQKPNSSNGKSTNPRIQKTEVLFFIILKKGNKKKTMVVQMQYIFF